MLQHEGTAVHERVTAHSGKLAATIKHVESGRIACLHFMCTCVRTCVHFFFLCVCQQLKARPIEQCDGRDECSINNLQSYDGHVVKSSSTWPSHAVMHIRQHHSCYCSERNFFWRIGCKTCGQKTLWVPRNGCQGQGGGEHTYHARLADSVTHVARILAILSKVQLPECVSSQDKVKLRQRGSRANFWRSFASKDLCFWWFMLQRPPNLLHCVHGKWNASTPRQLTLFGGGGDLNSFFVDGWASNSGGADLVSSEPKHWIWAAVDLSCTLASVTPGTDAAQSRLVKHKTRL